MEALTITFFDVGQGDCTVLHTSMGQTILVDAHCVCEDDFLRITEHLSSIAKKRSPASYDIDILCLTHPDQDHYTGMLRLIQWIEKQGGRIKGLILSAIQIKEFQEQAITYAIDLAKQPLEPRCQINPALATFLKHQRELGRLLEKFSEIRSDIDKRGGVFERARYFIPILPDMGLLKINILGPCAHRLERVQTRMINSLVRSLSFQRVPEDCDSNEVSAILWFLYGSHQVLLLGDSPSAGIRKVLKRYQRLPPLPTRIDIVPDIVKASHHGGRSGSSQSLWRGLKLGPKSELVFSAGNHPFYKHPHEDIFIHLSAIGAKPRISCTNWCPMHCPKERAHEPLRTQMGRASDLTDYDSRPIEGRSPYNGDCTFVIGYHGDIKRHTQKAEPDVPCPLHQPKTATQ